MAKQSVSKNFSVQAKGILSINGPEMTISVEDVGDFAVHKLLKEFDDCEITLSVKYNEEQGSPDEDIEVDIETGEVIE